MARRKTPNYEAEPPATLTDELFYGIQLDEKQLALANAIWSNDNDIIFVNAKAGTGKTTVSIGVANMLVGYKMYSSIIYIMSPYGESVQGFLPGTQTEKSSVYFEALYQALTSCNVVPATVINDESMVNQKNGTGYVTAVTDTYLRGSNLNDAVVVIDEAQNYTFKQLKKVLTRVCDHCKVIVIGHDQQCDLKDKKSSGFARYIEHFRNHERCAVCELTENHRSWISSWADEAREEEQ